MKIETEAEYKVAVAEIESLLDAEMLDGLDAAGSERLAELSQAVKVWEEARYPKRTVTPEQAAEFRADQEGRKEWRVDRAELRTAWRRGDPDDPPAMGFILRWEGEAGFGELTVLQDHGKVTIQTEAMSEQFVRAVFAKFIDGATLDPK